ncbi:hypothetical protein G6F57_022039 [Rhizopus arrhizus]|nr:hypothetical protein G6F57_022039 [Rhizopus arrhizus]
MSRAWLDSTNGPVWRADHRSAPTSDPANEKRRPSGRRRNRYLTTRRFGRPLGGGLAGGVSSGGAPSSCSSTSLGGAVSLPGMSSGSARPCPVSRA